MALRWQNILSSREVRRGKVKKIRLVARLFSHQTDLFQFWTVVQTIVALERWSYVYIWKKEKRSRLFNLFSRFMYRYRQTSFTSMLRIFSRHMWASCLKLNKFTVVFEILLLLKGFMYACIQTEIIREYGKIFF